MATTAVRRQYQRIIWALALFLVIHLLALPAMALLVRPGFDVARTDLERATFISENRWLWRLGWLPWQLSALSDVIFSIFLIQWVRARQQSAALKWAIAGLGLNLAASIPEQISEAILVTGHVGLADQATTNPEALQDFADQERFLFGVASVWSGFVYVAMTLAWHRALSLTAGVTGWFDGFAGRVVLIALVALSALAGLAAIQVTTDWTSPVLVAVVAAVGFLGMCLWSLAAADLAGQPGHIRAQDASLHDVRWPADRRFSFVANIVASTGLRDLGRLVPFMPLRSDIEDVVYLNWLVPTTAAQGVLPKPLVCDDLDGMTAVSILTYRHGHFGPSIFGPLRKLMPSPSQSNWRLYIEPVPASGERDAIYFFKTALDSIPHVMGAHLVADGLPVHLAQRVEHTRASDTITSLVDPGGGSAPGLRSVVTEDDQGQLPPAWQGRFSDWESAVHYLVEQNRALFIDADAGSVCESQIHIPMEHKTIVPVTITSFEIDGIPAELLPQDQNSTLLGFVVPSVRFDALRESPVGPIS